MPVSTDSPAQAQQFWTTDRRGAVEIATFSNPPHNYLDKPVIDALAQLVVQWWDPSIRAVVIQSRPEEAGICRAYLDEPRRPGSVSDLDQYPMPERFEVTFNAERGHYQAIPAKGPWADGSIPGVEAMIAIGETPAEAIKNARLGIEHLRAEGS
jgi:hypothetical protein